MLEYGLLSPLSLCLWQHGKAKKSAYLTAAKKGTSSEKETMKEEEQKEEKTEDKMNLSKTLPSGLLPSPKLVVLNL